MGTLKLPDCWLSRVPTKTKAGQMVEQRLFSWQLRLGTLKLSGFWLRRVSTKTNDDGATPLFIAAQTGHIEVVRFLVGSGANKDQGRTNDGETQRYVADQNGHVEVARFLVESGANRDRGIIYCIYLESQVPYF